MVFHAVVGQPKQNKSYLDQSLLNLYGTIVKGDLKKKPKKQQLKNTGIPTTESLTGKRMKMLNKVKPKNVLVSEMSGRKMDEFIFG